MLILHDNFYLYDRVRKVKPTYPVHQVPQQNHEQLSFMKYRAELHYRYCYIKTTSDCRKHVNDVPLHIGQLEILYCV